MSTKLDVESQGRAQRPSGAIDSGADAIGLIAAHLHEMAVGRSGELTPNAQFQIDLRSADERKEILERLLLEICPNGVDHTAWLTWLRGGKSPFPERPLRKVGLKSEWPSQTLTRTTPRVTKQEEKVENLRAELAAAEERLTYLKAHDNAAIHWHVVDQLISIVAPIFAMGPAWTIMRAVSGYLSQENADHLTRMLEGKEKDRAVDEYRAVWQTESEKLIESLDQYSGIPRFERRLRAAILDAVKGFVPEPKEVDERRSGVRSKAEMRETAHPEALQDRDAILQGLKPRA